MPRMGRPRTKDRHLPLHMRQVGRSYYYDTQAKPRKWIPLGSEYQRALALWARLEGSPIPDGGNNFSQVAKWYRKQFGKPAADGTYQMNRDAERELDALEMVFGPSPIETIEPVDVKTYLTGRMSRKKLKEGEEPKPAPVRANREISRLSHVINSAREYGLTTMSNPCAGVSRNEEVGRDRYAEDAEFDAIYAAGDDLLRDAMDLMLFTSQRPTDTVKARKTHIVNGALRVKQGKTGTIVPITLEGDFAAAVERMIARPRNATSVYLVADKNGQPITYWQLEDRWSATRAKVAETIPSVADLQMRDIRGKAATDVEDLAHAQKLLGHKSRAMTEKYVKQRAGDRVAPLTRRKKA